MRRGDGAGAGAAIALLVAAGCGGGGAPTAVEREALARSEAVRVLEAPDTSSYRIIYHPAVDLAKRPSPGS